MSLLLFLPWPVTLASSFCTASLLTYRLLETRSAKISTSTSRRLREKDLEDEFYNCGRIRDIILKPNFAFIEFDYRDDAVRTSLPSAAPLAGLLAPALSLCLYACYDPSPRSRTPHGAPTTTMRSFPAAAAAA